MTPYIIYIVCVMRNCMKRPARDSRQTRYTPPTRAYHNILCRIYTDKARAELPPRAIHRCLFLMLQKFTRFQNAFKNKALRRFHHHIIPHYYAHLHDHHRRLFPKEQCIKSRIRCKDTTFFVSSQIKLRFFLKTTQNNAKTGQQLTTTNQPYNQ